MFKAAVVGLGNIGPHHCKCYQSTKEIQLAAVVDLVPERAEKFGTQFNVPSYTDLKPVLKRKDIDFIDVCVPSGLHGEIAIAAARARKHCICEKPLDVTPQRCDQIIKAFRKSGTVLGGIYQHRFADDVQKAKAAIAAGRFGRITLATCSTPWWRTQEYYDSGDWRGTWKLDGGGALMNQGIHAIDLLMYLVGDIKTVWARTAMLAHERIEVEDVAVAVVEFAHGALGVIQGTTAAYPGTSVRHEIMGTQGTAYLHDDKSVFWKLQDEMEAQAAGQAGQAAAPAAKAEAGASADPLAVSSDIFVRTIDNVAYAARTGTAPIVTGEEHRKAVEVICAIYKSAQTGKPVALPLKSFKPRV
jgi:predicted dehydrogenase